MASQWFWEREGEQKGPVSSAELKSLAKAGEVTPATLIWKEGLGDWRPAGKLRGLFDDPASAPAAFTASPVGSTMPPAVAAMRQPAGTDAFDGNSDDGISGGGVEPEEDAIPLAAEDDEAPADVQPLDYASQILAAVAGETGPVVQIAKSFSYPKSAWLGTVYVSPLAIYLIKIRSTQSGGYHVGGAAGYLIMRGISGGKTNDVRTGAARALPPAVAQLIKPKVLQRADAIVLPRTAVSLVKPGVYFKVTCGGDKFTLKSGRFKRRKTREAFESNGWTLGVELTPTTAPIHGDGLGRVPGEAGGKRLSPLARACLLVGGIALIVLVIYLRIKFDTQNQ